MLVAPSDFVNVRVAPEREPPVVAADNSKCVASVTDATYAPVGIAPLPEPPDTVTIIPTAIAEEAPCVIVVWLV